MKIQYIVLTLAFIFTAYNLLAQDNLDELKLENFKFLVGKWEADFGDFKYYEEWQRENDKFLGKGYRIKMDKRFDGEKLILINIHGYFSYIATVGKQQPILFALIENIQTKDSSFVFENKEHDFPQRIIYKIISSDSIIVSVEGKIKDKFVTDEYILKRYPD